MIASILLCGAAFAAVPPETLPAVQAKMYPGAQIETACAGTNGWVAIDYVKDIEKGSALDFAGWGSLTVLPESTGVSFHETDILSSRNDQVRRRGSTV